MTFYFVDCVCLSCESDTECLYIAIGGCFDA